MGPVKKKCRAPGLTPCRAAVLEALWRQPDPVGVAALAHAAGRHPNTVREPLAWLVEQGLVERVRQPSEGRGRPAWLYVAARGPHPSPGEHVEVMASLAWQLQQKDPPDVTDALEAGAAWAEHLVEARGTVAEPGPEAARRYTVDLLDDLGYHPETDDDAYDVTLRRCPLLQAAHLFPTIVCALHLALVRTSLADNGGDPDAADLIPFSAPGECHLVLGERSAHVDVVT